MIEGKYLKSPIDDGGARMDRGEGPIMDEDNARLDESAA